MNELPGTSPVIPNAVPPPAAPVNWQTALADLAAARLALIQLELKQAAQSGAKRGIFFAAAAVLLLFTWGLIVAGLIGVISAKGNFPWYWVTLIIGAFHLLLAGILISLAKRPADPAFKITAAEFKKDREWLKTLQSHPTSND